jgi:tetratricopeptide (TPR) repeat protein
VYGNVPVNIPRTDSLLWNVYRYAGLFEADSLDLDPTNRNITTNLSFAFYSLGQAYLAAGETDAAIENLVRAMHLAPTAYPQLGPALAAMAESAEARSDTGPAAPSTSDSARRDSGG